jgi:hypothetical protein
MVVLPITKTQLWEPAFVFIAFFGVLEPIYQDGE